MSYCKPGATYDQGVAKQMKKKNGPSQQHTPEELQLHLRQLENAKGGVGRGFKTCWLRAQTGEDMFLYSWHNCQVISRLA
mmetsp:Transcript_92856/g.259437  ORF Transcript_92856/g.259437 Transcript_92856/m.259437 type:complete len:80 (+) Transcript_92856:108-347(+)